MQNCLDNNIGCATGLSPREHFLKRRWQILWCHSKIADWVQNFWTAKVTFTQTFLLKKLWVRNPFVKKTLAPAEFKGSQIRYWDMIPHEFLKIGIFDFSEEHLSEWNITRALPLNANPPSSNSPTSTKQQSSFDSGRFAPELAQKPALGLISSRSA